MKKVKIKEILIDEDKRFCVIPEMSKCGDFEFIYRDSSGIRWDPKINALVAYEPLRWQPIELFKQIISAVVSEYGCYLYLRDTIWTNIPVEVKEETEAWLFKYLLSIENDNK